LPLSPNAKLKYLGPIGVQSKSSNFSPFRVSTFRRCGKTARFVLDRTPTATRRINHSFFFGRSEAALFKPSPDFFPASQLGFPEFRGGEVIRFNFVRNVLFSRGGTQDRAGMIYATGSARPGRGKK
jgi:hypothetical protein